MRTAALFLGEYLTKITNVGAQVYGHFAEIVRLFKKCMTFFRKKWYNTNSSRYYMIVLKGWYFMFENCAIRHKAFGEGTVVAVDETHIRVRFSDENQTEKVFLYPEAFENFLALVDEEMQKLAMNDFASKKAAKDKAKAERSAEFHKMDLARRRERAEKLKKSKKTATATAKKTTKTEEKDEEAEELPKAE